MFGIVNHIDYDGLMIDGTAPETSPRFQQTYPSLPDSKWPSRRRNGEGLQHCQVVSGGAVYRSERQGAVEGNEAPVVRGC